MAHKVTFEVPARQLGRADISFQVKNNNAMIGKLLVSKGSIVWRPRKCQKGKKLSWKRFNDIMERHGKDER